MALETFRAQLKAKAKTLGVTNLSNKRIDAYAATLEKQNPNLTTDDDHAEKVDSFLDLIDIKEIAAYDDYKASKGRNGGKPEEKDKPEPGTPDKPANPPAGNEMPEWFKPFAQTVQALAADKTQTSIRSKLADKLKDKVPAGFYDEWTLPEKDEDLDAFVEKVETKWKALKQDDNNAGLGGMSTPANGTPATGGKDTKVDSDVVNFAKKQTEKLTQKTT
jgi:hypothetical protein